MTRIKDGERLEIARREGNLPEALGLSTDQTNDPGIGTILPDGFQTHRLVE
jgi:hypothetical protein